MNENIVESVALAEGDLNDISGTLMPDATQAPAPVQTDTTSAASVEVEEPELEEGPLPGIDEDEFEEVDAPEEHQEEPQPEQPQQPEFTPLPENSKSYLYRENMTRFSGAAWFEEIQRTSVIVAGIGGIGSWVTLLLSRLGLESITIFDDDRIERVNMAGQFFESGNVGTYKTHAMRQLCERFSSYYNMAAYNMRFTRNSPIDRIMICGFDNMASRKLFYERWKNQLTTTNHKNEYLFIDGRLLMEELQVFCIQGDDDYNLRRYETEFLFSDEEAVEPMCSAKQTSFMANMIGSLIVNLLVNFVANKQQDMLYPRDLPFMTVYYGDRMYFKTEA